MTSIVTLRRGRITENDTIRCSGARIRIISLTRVNYETGREEEEEEEKKGNMYDAP